MLSATDTYHVLLIALGQPTVNSAGFGLPEQLAPSAQLAMVRTAQGQLRLQRLRCSSCSSGVQSSEFILVKNDKLTRKALRGEVSTLYAVDRGRLW